MSVSLIINYILNDEPSFRCADGFTLNETTCIDINECDTNVCSPSANCINTKGSFSCKCLPGFVGDGFNCTGKIVWLLLVIFKLFYKY